MKPQNSGPLFLSHGSDTGADGFDEEFGFLRVDGRAERCDPKLGKVLGHFEDGLGCPVVGAEPHESVDMVVDEPRGNVVSLDVDDSCGGVELLLREPLLTEDVGDFSVFKQHGAARHLPVAS